MLVISTLLALVGHNWPVILSFKGGRGIAIAAGTLLVLTTIPALIGLAIFFPVTLISKYLSLGSILGVIGAVISIVIMTFFGIYPIQYSVYGIIAGVVIIFQHRDNIKRIISRTERKIGQPGVKIK
jgi:glycerol-3-phosphate acyltransferase PlsY